VEWYWQGKTEKNPRRTCPSATSSTTNSTWTNSGANSGLRSERSLTNRLSHGTSRFIEFLSAVSPAVVVYFKACALSDSICDHNLIARLQHILVVDSRYHLAKEPYTVWGQLTLCTRTDSKNFCKHETYGFWFCVVLCLWWPRRCYEAVHVAHNRSILDSPAAESET
jgi:hypothetical protein